MQSLENVSNPNANSRRRGLQFMNVVNLVVPTIAIFYVFSRFIPSAFYSDYPVINFIDNSWTLAFHEAFIRHLQAGRDIIFTYGPWGFLARGYHPATHLVAVTVWGFLTAVFLIAGWRLARTLSANRNISWLWLGVLAAVASTPLGNDFDVRLVVWIALLLGLHFFVETEGFTSAQALLVISLGCLSLVKFTGLVEAAIVISLITANDLFRRGRCPWSLLLWVGSLLGFWILAGQQVQFFGAYLVNSWQITSGYTEAMMEGATDGWNLIGFLVLGAWMMIFLTKICWEKNQWWGALPLAGFGLMLLVVFKLGYVRHDQHELGAAMALLAISLLILVLVRADGKKKTASAILLLVASTGFASAVFHYWLPYNGLPVQLARTLKANNLLAPLASVPADYLRSEYTEFLARVKNNYPLPAMADTTDTYSYDQTVVFSHGFKYRPRPIIQSYSVFTPRLAEINAAWLRSSEAATNVLFRIQPLDNRFPSLEDGLSWPELLTRYEIHQTAAAAETYLLLTRSATPQPYHFTLLKNVVASFTENIKLPAATNGLFWVEIEIKKTFAGKLVEILYKTPVLHLVVNLRNHEERRFRLVPGMARAGFLLSPLVADNHAFAALFTAAGRESLADLQVESMTISAETETGLTKFYQPFIPVRFYRLELPPQ